MYYTKVEAWYDVGFTEGDLMVPFSVEALPVKPDYIFDPRDGIHPSADRFFTLLRLPFYFDSLRNIKYLRLTTSTNMIYYGWVESVKMLTHEGNNFGEGSCDVYWHIDYWFTYYSKVEHISGWVVKRNPYEEEKLNPPQDIPARYLIPCPADSIALGDQIPGIQWVILTFGASVGYIASMFALGSEIMPVNWGMNDLIDAAKNLPGMALRWLWPSKASEEVPAPPYNPVQTADLYCLAFPITMQHDRYIWLRTKIKVRDGKGWRDENYDYCCPSLDELLDGTLMKAFGVKHDKILSCSLSPIAPIKVKEGTGADDDPFVIETPDKYKRESAFNRNNYKIKGYEWQGYGYLSVGEDLDLHKEMHSRGFYNTGLIVKGCPKLGGLLDSLDVHPSLDTMNEVIFSTPFNSVAIQSSKHEYMRLDRYIALLFDSNPYWDVFSTSDDTELKVYKINNPVENWWYSDKSQLVANRYVWFRRNESAYNFTLLKNVAHVRRDLSQWIFYVKKPVEPNKPQEYEKVKGSFIDYYIKLGEQKICAYSNDDLLGVNMTRFSTSLLRIRYFIQASTLVWPLLNKRLPQIMYSDFARILVLVGPSGNIIHKFRQNQKIEAYSYEVVIGQTETYIRFRFWGLYSMLADAEVTVPLPSIPLATNQLNEYSATGARANDMIMSQLQSKDRKEAGEKSQSLSTLGTIGSFALGAFGAGAGFSNALSTGASIWQSNQALKLALAQSDKAASRMQQMKDMEALTGGSAMAVHGSLATLHDPVPLCLMYLMRDNYSVKDYLETADMTGIEVNEYVDDLTKTPLWDIEGPIQMRNVAVIGKELPQEAVMYIATKLSQGIYLKNNPSERYKED